MRGRTSRLMLTVAIAATAGVLLLSIARTSAQSPTAAVKSSAMIELSPPAPLADDPTTPNPMPYGAPNPSEYTLLPVPRSEKIAPALAAG